jgi:hypothetical protein
MLGVTDIETLGVIEMEGVADTVMLGVIDALGVTDTLGVMLGVGLGAIGPLTCIMSNPPPLAFLVRVNPP